MTNTTTVIQNEVLDCIFSRRSTRSFEERQIEPEQLNTLLEAAIWAPSGSNSQSWLFTAIQNREKLLYLIELMREAFKNWTPDDDYPAKHRAKKNSQLEEWNSFYNAPTLIVTSNVASYGNAMADCSLAAENIFLAAHSLGLGTCYINHLHWLEHDKGIRDYLFTLGIPKEHTICAGIAVGYIKTPSIAKPRREGTINIIR